MGVPLALVWDLIVTGNAPEGFLKTAAAADKAAVATERGAKGVEAASARMAAASAKLTRSITLPVVAIAAVSTKMAGDFQFQMNRMVTAAGESRKNLKMVSDGVLSMMASTGTSAKQLEAGLYLIESAGFHGAAGLKVLEVAAKGAKIENADLATVSNAVTSAMVDYHVKAGDAAKVMNTLIAGVARGKTTLGEMSHAFSNVGAAGALAKVPMADLVGAIAEMTRHGTDASKAGTYLRQTIGQLEGGSARARLVMKGLGIDANKVGQVISSGPGGLGKAIGMLDEGLRKHLTPSGLVAVEMFKKSKGSLSDFQKVLGNIPPSLVTTFSAMAAMTGGVKSMQGVLQLGGKNLGDYRTTVDGINQAVQHGGKSIEGWASVQQTLNQKLSQMGHGAEAAAIKLGTLLIPAVTKLLSWITSLTNWFEHLSGGWKKTIVIAGLFLVALGPILGIISRLVIVFGFAAKSVAFLATPFTRLGATIAETGGLMGGLAARTAESEAMMTRAVVAGSTEQIAAMDRLMATQRLMAENAAATSGMVARSGAALGAGGAGMAGRAGAAGRTGRFGGISGGAGMNAALFSAVSAKMGYDAGSAASHGNKVVALTASVGGAASALGHKMAPLVADWLGLSHKMKSSVKDLFTIDSYAPASIAAFSAALVAGGSALKANQAAVASAALAHTGLVAGAAKAGLQEKDLTNALTGSSAAYNQVVATWKASGTASGAQLLALHKLREEFQQGGVAARKYADAHGLVIASEVRSASMTAFLAGKLGNLNKMHLTGAQAASIYNRNVQAVTASVAANGKTLDGNTLYGQRNIATIRHAAVMALEHAQAVYQQTHSLAKADRALQSDREELYKTATRAGLTKGEVKKLADAIYGVPANRRSKITVDTAGAMRDLSSFGAYYDNYIAGLSGKHIAGPVVGAATGPGMQAGIGGLVIPGKAAGGPVRDGWFTTGEGHPNTWELGFKQGSKLDFFSNRDSKAMTGLTNPPGFAAGTQPGVGASSDLLISELRRATHAIQEVGGDVADALNSTAKHANLQARTMPAGRNW